MAVFVVFGSIPILICLLLIALMLFWHQTPQSIKTKVIDQKHDLLECTHSNTREVFYPLMSHSLFILLKPADYPDSTVISSIIYVSVLASLCSFVHNFLMKN